MRNPKSEKPDPRWTHRDLTGEQFLALCARAARGECRLEQFGVGSSNALWCAAVRERREPAPVREEDVLPW